MREREGGKRRGGRRTEGRRKEGQKEGSEGGEKKSVPEKDSSHESLMPSLLPS